MAFNILARRLLRSQRGPTASHCAPLDGPHVWIVDDSSMEIE